MNRRHACHTLLTALSLLSGCAAGDATLGARAGDQGHCVATGPNRVVTAEHVTSRAGRLQVRCGRDWIAGETVTRHPLPNLPWADALVELEVQGLERPPVQWHRLSDADAGRGIYVYEEGRWACVGLYLGDLAPELGELVPPRPSWVDGGTR